MLSPLALVSGLSLTVALASSCSSADSASTAGSTNTAASATAASATAASATATAAGQATAASATGGATAGAVPSDSISERADRGRIQGSESAGVWIVEASDFQCPFCKTWHDASYEAIVRDYVRTGKARIAYINYPLRQHQHSMEAAEAAMCASVQGKFWEMHESLFGSQQQWENLPSATAYFDSLATRANVAMPAWRDCTAKHLTRPLIDADLERGKTAGVGSTPTFFIGDQKIEGAQPLTLFREVIEAQLAKAKGSGQNR